MGRVENGRVPPLSLKARVRLYFVVGFTACPALSSALFASKFHEIFFDVFGDEGNLPACTNVVLHTAPFWVLIPVLMLLLFYWSMRRGAHPRLQHWVWSVAVYGCIWTNVLMLASAVCLFMPFRAGITWALSP